MKRRNFIKTASLTTLAASATGLGAQTPAAAEQQMLEWRVYHLKWGSSARPLHEFLENGLIPALNRAGVSKVGVFTEMADPTPGKLYVLISYDSLNHLAEASGKLAEDTAFQKANAEYAKAPPEKPVYARMDKYMLEAFSGWPETTAPDSEERIFELRTYEGYNEDAVRRKVKMFNSGEIDIFMETGLHPVFFGQILAGPAMPALIYMLWFKDMEERDENWAKFVNHPEWKKMSPMPEYANTVSNILRVFLKPVDYSQI
jgi:hypothetical protein